MVITSGRHTAVLQVSQRETSNLLPDNKRPVWLSGPRSGWEKMYVRIAELPTAEPSVGAETSPWEFELGGQLLPAVRAPMTSWLFCVAAADWTRPSPLPTSTHGRIRRMTAPECRGKVFSTDNTHSHVLPSLAPVEMSCDVMAVPGQAQQGQPRAHKFPLWRGK